MISHFCCFDENRESWRRREGKGSEKEGEDDGKGDEGVTRERIKT